MQAYSDPKRESDPHALPNIEVFHVGPGERDECPLCLDGPELSKYYCNHANHVGYYWWPCFPGRLPDSDPCGPFTTEAEALADARKNCDDGGQDDDDDDDDEGAQARAGRESCRHRHHAPCACGSYFVRVLGHLVCRACGAVRVKSAS